MWIQVDADCQGAGGHRGGGTNAEPASEIALANDRLPLARVVTIQDMRHSGPPTGAWPAGHLHPDPRIGLDVLYPVCAASALRNEPEGLAVQAVRTQAYAAAARCVCQWFRARR